MKQFPKLQLVLEQGGYPRITETLALALTLNDTVLEKYLYRNAKNLLNLSLRFVVYNSKKLQIKHGKE